MFILLIKLDFKSILSDRARAKLMHVAHSSYFCIYYVTDRTRV